MTIIACSSKERLMAADTGLIDTDNMTIVGFCTKIFRTPNGTLVGSSGNVAEGSALIQWAMKGFKTKPKAEWFKDDTDLLCMNMKGEIAHYEGPTPERGMIEFAASGAGVSIATAMHGVGKTVEECVAAAIKFNPLCNGDVTVLRLDDYKPRARGRPKKVTVT